MNKKKKPFYHFII